MFLKPLDPMSMDIIDWQYLARRFPGVNFPHTARTEWNLSSDKIKVGWETDVGTSGEAHLSKVDGSRPSDLEPLDIKSWDDFRRYVTALWLRTNSCFVVKATTDGGCGQPSTGRRARSTKLAPKMILQHFISILAI